MRISQYFSKAKKMPFDLFLKKSIAFIKRQLLKRICRLIDKYRFTYSNTNILVKPDIYTELILQTPAFPVIEVSNLNLKHRFSLLGSDWKENNRNDISSPAGYQPIDWQKDFKSGYRWSERTWYMDIKYAHKPGVDVKIPWELSRMQHLANYAYAFAITEGADKAIYLQEYQNEILDFIAHNPPRFGVNWRCTMDVGIRVANWLMAFDLFSSFGASFNEDFLKAFSNSVYDHALHIINNLEYSPNLTSNHYLSDIGGLIFAASHLESTPVTDAWLAFGMQELISEMKREFHEDGSNFEASTSYHCLSTEIMLFSSAACTRINSERRARIKHYDTKIVSKVPKLKPIDKQLFDLDSPLIFPENFWKKLLLALEFVANISDEYGHIAQIGDADSGRFFKLSPVFVKITGKELKAKYLNLKDSPMPDNDIFYDEDMLNHDHLIKDLFILHGNTCHSTMSIEQQLLTHIDLRHIQLENNPVVNCLYKTKSDALQEIPEHYKKIDYTFNSTNSIISELQIIAYSGMGLYIFKSNNMLLIARCGEVGQNGLGGHSHNDQLSVTLRMNGKDYIRDCGSYLYTPYPDLRNKFRSTRAHFTPQIPGKEQNEWWDGPAGLFSIKKEQTFSKLLYLGEDGIVMSHVGFGDPVYRVVNIAPNCINISDYGIGIAPWTPMGVWSNGYGKLLKQ